MKGIENPDPSVIEKLNSVLENSRYLVLNEDNQDIIKIENCILIINILLVFQF